MPKKSTDKQQSLDELKVAFSYFDRNHDGSIEADELGDVMRSLGYKVTADELREMIGMADVDGNDKVEFDEFVTVMTRHEMLAKRGNGREGEDILRTAFKVGGFENDIFGFDLRFGLSFEKVEQN